VLLARPSVRIVTLPTPPPQASAGSGGAKQQPLQPRKRRAPARGCCAAKVGLRARDIADARPDFLEPVAEATTTKDALQVRPLFEYSDTCPRPTTC
jgi:hypothetical protein